MISRNLATLGGTINPTGSAPTAVDPTISDLVGSLVGQARQVVARPTQISNASASSSNVSVNPSISVVTGGGSVAANPSGSASGSPSADARPVYSGGYGYGAGVLPLESAGDVPPELTGQTSVKDTGGDLMKLALWGAAGLAAWMMMGS